MSGPDLGHIIIVDDEKELMTVLCDVLSERGYQVVGFTDGNDALKMIEEQDFDLILTDLMMPGMDGISLLKAATEIDPHLMGIIMTGQGTVQTAVEAMKTGAFDYITKPFKINVLLPVVARAFDVRNLRLENIELRSTMAIYELTRAITFSTDLQIVAKKVAEAAMEQCGADDASLMLLAENGTDLYVAAVSGEGRNHLIQRRVRVGEGIAGWVASHREIVDLQGHISDARFSSLYPRPEIKRAISMPMMAGGTFVGVLNINCMRRHTFAAGQIKALNIVISMAAPALHNASLFEQLRHTMENLRRATKGTVQAMAATVERRDPYTAGHQRRVADLARAIAHAMHLPDDTIDGVFMAGMIHDVGKVAVPSEILSKPGTLTQTEFSLIKSHPSIGYDILKDIEFPWPIAKIVLQHHERSDGSGYPGGLRSDQLLLESHILMVADVVEAMASHRPYRPSLGIEDALAEIKEHAGSRYDARVVDTCLALFREQRFAFE